MQVELQLAQCPASFSFFFYCSSRMLKIALPSNSCVCTARQTLLMHFNLGYLSLRHLGAAHPHLELEEGKKNPTTTKNRRSCQNAGTWSHFKGVSLTFGTGLFTCKVCKCVCTNVNVWLGVCGAQLRGSSYCRVMSACRWERWAWGRACAAVRKRERGLWSREEATKWNILEA